MHLVLTVENAAAFETRFVTRWVIETGAVTIGRGGAAGWQLPDVSRFLSAEHCRIDAQDGKFFLEDLSRNGVTLRGERMKADSRKEIRTGDRIALGPFLLRADVMPGAPVEVDGDRTVIAGSIAAQPETTLYPIAAKAALPAPILTSQIEPAPKPSKPKPRPAAQNYSSEFVAQFATAAGIDPERLAGRTDAEFARELGELMRLAFGALGQLQHTAHEVRAIATGEIDASDHGASNSNDLLLHVLSSGHSREEMEEVADVIAGHDRIFFPALQTALFRLLNDMAPTTIEARVGASVLRSKKSACWDEYGRLWEDFSATGKNGVLDVLLAHLNDAYQARLLNE